MTELPKGWVEVSIAETGLVATGNTPSTKEKKFYGSDIPYAKPSDLFGRLITDTEHHLSKDGLAVGRKVEAGAILVSCIGNLGKTGLASRTMAFNQQINAIQPYEGIEPRFLFRQIQTAKFNQALTALSSATTISIVNKGAFERQTVLLAPTKEQRRIVAKIEAMFERIDKGVESLAAAKTTLGLYRQSLLKSAFEGRLTAAWRSQNPDKLEPPKALLARIQKERETRYKSALDDWQTALSEWRAGGEVGRKPGKPRRDPEQEAPMSEQRQKMHGLPAEWQWLQIGVFAFVTKLAGFEYTDHVKYRDDGDLAVIKAENAGKAGFKVTDYSKVRFEEVAMLTRSHLKGGELLMVFVGAGTGNVATVPADRSYFLGPNIGMIRVETPDIISSYVEHFLRSPVGNLMKLASVKAVAQPSISMGTIRQIPIAVPSPAEQAEITRILDARLTAADAMEAEINAALSRAEALRQSILKQAFAGTLVPQDPTDEPAPTLLARIKAERAKAATSKTKRTTA